MLEFGGSVLYLDRENINTDEIIPARYLTEIERVALAPHLLEDLRLTGFQPQGNWRGQARVVVARENFGCGSSREHAVWALGENDLTVVVAPSFARIFERNMYNCGMLALTLPAADIAALFARAADLTDCAVDFAGRRLSFSGSGAPLTYAMHVSGFNAALVEAGGWIAYADAHY